MGRKPIQEQNQQAVELIEALRKKLKCGTDAELAAMLDVLPPRVANWKKAGLPAALAAMMEIYLGKRKLSKQK